MKTSRLISICSVLAGTISFAVAGLALAQETPEEKPVHCLHLNNIKDSEVISDSYILFRMLDGKAYVNILNHRCPGLARNTPIMYRTSIGELCDLDVVTVLENMGFGLTPGASCGLGRFKPIDKDGIADLKEAVKKDRQ